MKQKPKADNVRSKTRAQTDVAIQRRIGDELRHMYSRIIEEPVPDKFLKLLEELEDKENSRK